MRCFWLCFLRNLGSPQLLEVRDCVTFVFAHLVLVGMSMREKKEEVCSPILKDVLAIVWGADHIGKFLHHPSVSTLIIVWKVVGQHLFMNIIPNNFTVGTERKVWCDQGMSLRSTWFSCWYNVWENSRHKQLRSWCCYYKPVACWCLSFFSLLNWRTFHKFFWINQSFLWSFFCCFVFETKPTCQRQSTQGNWPPGKFSVK